MADAGAASTGARVAAQGTLAPPAPAPTRSSLAATSRGSGIPCGLFRPLYRHPFVAAPAKTHESTGRFVEFGPAGPHPPFPPLAFQRVDIVAGRSGAGFVVSFLGQGWQTLIAGGSGRFLPPAFTVIKSDLIRLVTEGQAVIRQVVMLDDVLHHRSKATAVASRAGFLEQ